MPRVVLIAGEPASGKSSVMRDVIGRLGPSQEFEFKKLVKGLFFKKQKVWLLGVYAEPYEEVTDEHAYPGTDRLSMGVMPTLLQWMTCLHDDQTVLAEGDRVTNRSFLKAAAQYPEHHFFLLKTSHGELLTRHMKRRDSQSDSFIRRQRTKLQGLTQEFGFKTLYNENSLAREENLARLLPIICPPYGPQ